MDAKKIFIWETELIIALDLKTTLIKAGFEAKIIKTAEGLENMIKNENPILFILCTDLDSKKNAIIISAAKDFKIPVVVLSSIRKDLVNNLTLAAACEFLLKPFDKQELINSVSACLKSNPPAASYSYANS